MEHPADTNSTKVPTSYALVVPAHGPEPSSCNVPARVHPEGDRKIIVLALHAPDNPNPGPFRVARQRRTFWTTCTSCEEMNKYSIGYLNCNISCIHCSETFKAVEVTRPRNYQSTTTLSETMEEPASTLKSESQNFAPLRKKLRRGFSVIEAVEPDVKMLLKCKGKTMIEERTKETGGTKNNDEHLTEPTQDEGDKAEA